VKFSSIAITTVIFIFIIVNNTMAFVSRPVDNIPGVAFPTPNPAIPTSAPNPTIVPDTQTVKPVYQITTPTSNPTPLFQEIKEETVSTDKKQSSSTLRIILFLLGTVVIVGGLIFFYKMKG